MELRILGPLEVRGDAGVVAVPAGRLRGLLIRLAVAAPGVVAMARLADDLSPEEGRRRVEISTLRTYVARLRTALPAGVIETRDGGYMLDTRGVTIDADLFESEVAHSRALIARNPDEASAHLVVALERWRGPALVDVLDLAWARPIATRLEEARLDALELRVEADLLAGRHRDLVAELAELTRDHPMRERLWGHRIVALYRSGRQADALACYREVHTLLRDELGLEPSADLRALERAVLEHSLDLELSAPPGGSATVGVSAPAEAPAPTNLPRSPTALVGREREQSDVAELMDLDQVVTLTGAGGVGKSRLALEVGMGALGRYRDGVWLVELARLSDSEGLEGLIAGELRAPRREGQPLRDVLLHHLAGRELLLILDNGEHLIDAVAELVRAIVGASEGIRVLVTSREALGLIGERVVAVSPLALVDDHASLGDILASPSVQLFERRAAAVSPGFSVDETNASTIARICRRLDGLPLAIELAAARMRMLSPVDLDSRLNERFRLLTGGRRALPRHQTLRNAIDWSYDLLEPSVQRVFRRLSVFAGPFDLRAAEAVAVWDAGDDSVIDLVGGLIDRSLLVVDRHDGEIRYRLLETIRQYGLDRLEETNELVEIRQRHADYFVGLARTIEDRLRGPEERQAYHDVVAWMDDLRAAFHWCTASERWDDAARIVASIRWDRVGPQVEREVSRWALGLVGQQAPLQPDLQARVYGTACIGAWLEGDMGRAHELATIAEDLAEPQGLECLVTVATATVWLRWMMGDVERAARIFVPLADPNLGDQVEPDTAAFGLAGIAMGMSESGIASASPDSQAFTLDLARRAVQSADVNGSPTVRSFAHLALGFCLLDVDEAEALAQLSVAAEIEDLAVPRWSLHARADRARLRALAGGASGILEEVRDVVATALARLDIIHLRLIAGLAGSALLSIEGFERATAGIAPLIREVFQGPVTTGWRRRIIELLDRLDPDVIVQVRAEVEGMDDEQLITWFLDELAKV